MATSSVPLTNVGSGYTIVTQVIPASTVPTTAGQRSGTLRKFLKGEPKALATVQVMNGVWMLLMGVVMIGSSFSRFVLYGFAFWGSLLHILAGILTISASKKLHPCVIKSSMAVNILSAITAALSIFLLFVDFSLAWRTCSGYGCGSTNHTKGISGVLLLFSLLQFCVSVAISAFACKATCSKEPTLNVISVVPHPEGYVPVDSSFPAYHAQPGNAVVMNSPPEGSPPPYDELKSESDN